MENKGLPKPHTFFLSIFIIKWFCSLLDKELRLGRVGITTCLLQFNKLFLHWKTHVIVLFTPEQPCNEPLCNQLTLSVCGDVHTENYSKFYITALML